MAIKLTEAEERAIKAKAQEKMNSMTADEVSKKAKELRISAIIERKRGYNYANFIRRGRMMKKILSFILVILMTIGICGCSLSMGTDSSEKVDSSSSSKSDVHCIGDTHKLSGISVTVTKIESGLYCGKKKSENGTWVRVYFSVSVTGDSKSIFYTDFTLNDTYTVRETSYSLTNIPSGGFALVEGNVYEFYVTFDSKYSPSEADLTFKFSKFLSGSRVWHLRGNVKQSV